MNTTTAPAQLDCESCGLDAEIRVAYLDPTFNLCLRCVPAELRPLAQALPGLEGLVDDVVQLLDEVHPASTSGTTAGSL